MKTQARKDYEKQWRENNKERVLRVAREYYHNNIEKMREKQRQYRLANKERETARTRRNYLKRKYGITEADYFAMLSSQGNRCKICDTDKPGGLANYFHVDHHHEDGDIRGLLCWRCNRTLGAVDDNVDILISMIFYLEAPA